MRELSEAKKLISNADAIAIFAGAGMSVDSGLDSFRGNNGLWTTSIPIEGVEYNYLDLMSHQAFDENPIDAWKFITHLKEKFEQTNPHEGYYHLLELLRDKDYFIVSSNIDDQFLKAGFDENKILEIHGSINFMQCMDILEREIWLTPDMNSNELRLDNLPACPNCGGHCRPNILLFGDWFWISIRSVHQQLRFQKCKSEIKASKKKIVALEIGAGKTIPTVRKASENFAKECPLIRVNTMDYEIKAPNHLSVQMGAKDFLLSI
jgi:NAD-dependent SIR2 family protein deacetylase